jgi:1-acyl-sn-glycerol-3-phosphate acyltransferase
MLEYFSPSEKEVRPLSKRLEAKEPSGLDADDVLAGRDPKRIALAMKWIERTLVNYHRAEVFGVERIPKGRGLYVGNHSAGSMLLDSYIAGWAIYKHGGMKDVPYALAHDLVLDLPVAKQLFRPVGAIRANHENAARVFHHGHKLMVYPGGEAETFRAFRNRNKIMFDGRLGYIRLALRHDVPIIPIVGQGAHGAFIVIDEMRWLAKLLRTDKILRVKTWPLTFSLPWGITLGPPPLFFPLPVKIRVEFLEPIVFRDTGEDAAKDRKYVEQCARQVETAMQKALTRLASM